MRCLEFTRETGILRGVLYKDKKVVVAMPAYNAAKTLQKTYGEVMDQGIVDLVVIVDDASGDETVQIAQVRQD